MARAPTCSWPPSVEAASCATHTRTNPPSVHRPHSLTTPCAAKGGSRPSGPHRAQVVQQHGLPAGRAGGALGRHPRPRPLPAHTPPAPRAFPPRSPALLPSSAPGGGAAGKGRRRGGREGAGRGGIWGRRGRSWRPRRAVRWRRAEGAGPRQHPPFVFPPFAGRVITIYGYISTNYVYLVVAVGW